MRYIVLIFSLFLISCEDAIDQANPLDSILPCTFIDIEDFCELNVIKTPEFVIIEINDFNFLDYGYNEYNLSVQYQYGSDIFCTFIGNHQQYNLFRVPYHQLQNANVVAIRTTINEDGEIYSQVQSIQFRFQNIE
jgi:hypothetical protein